MEITRHAWHHLLSERLVIIIVVKQVIQVECKVNIVVQQIRHTEIGYPIRIEPRVVRCITVYFTGITATQVKFQILQDTPRDGITAVCVESLVRYVALPVSFLAIQLLLCLIRVIALDSLDQFRILYFFHLPDLGVVQSITDRQR